MISLHIMPSNIYGRNDKIIYLSISLQQFKSSNVSLKILEFKFFGVKYIEHLKI
jgi:hypothetical protein